MTKHAVQVAAVVAGSIVATAAMLLEEPLPLAVLLSLVVLLAILDETAFTLVRRFPSLLLDALGYRLLMRTRLELLDDVPMRLFAMVTLRVPLWSRLVRLPIAHVLSWDVMSPSQGQRCSWRLVVPPMGMKKMLGQPYKDRAVGVHTRDEMKCLVRLPDAGNEEVTLLHLGLRLYGHGSSHRAGAASSGSTGR
jgi:hypothetical protein